VFSRNESALDRDIRIVLGAVLMYLAVFQIPGMWSFVVGAVAVVLFVTAAVGFCPLYALFHINTCPPSEGKRS